MKTMAGRYSDESSDENKNHRRRRYTKKPDSEDSDEKNRNYDRYSERKNRYDSDNEKDNKERYVSGRVEKEKEKNRYYSSDSDSEKDDGYNGRRDDNRDRYVSGRVESKDFDKEKMNSERYGSRKDDRESKDKDFNEKTNRESDSYGREKGLDLERNKTSRERESNKRDGKEREKGVIESSDSDREKDRRNVKDSDISRDKEKGRGDEKCSDKERKMAERVEREKSLDLDEKIVSRDRRVREKKVDDSSDSDKVKVVRKRDGCGKERNSGDDSSDFDKKKPSRDRRKRAVDYSSDSDKEKLNRKKNGGGRMEIEKNDLSDLDEKKVSRARRVRDKRADDSSDSDRVKANRKRNGGGRDRKGRDDDSSDSERDNRGGRKRRDDNKRSYGDRDRKRDRDRREKGNYEEEDRERRYLDRDRRDSRYERDERRGKEPNNGVKQDLNPQKVDVIANMANIGRTGGVYIPPFKLARMMEEVEDKSSVEYQRLTWDALRKSINGLVNKVNATNIKNIVPELFSENLVRGRGLFCRSCMKSQMASPGFTDVFAALVAVVNTKFPQIGYLLLKRIVLQLKRAYKRNDKPQLLAAVKFIAHLVNQQVVHELIALELLTLLLTKPTDDSVEVAVGFVTECGSQLQDLTPKGMHGIFESFRGILHEGEIDKRVQFLIEGLFAIRKAKFQGHPAVRPELDLVEQEDQLTHEISLADDTEDQDPETMLDVFKPDPDFLKNEKIYEEHKKNILGDESEEKSDSDAGSDDEDDEESEDKEEEEERMKIQDETETNLVNLRRTIYLTIMSSVDFEEAGHKLLKIKLEPGQEMELCIMLLECCSQERTYLRYYGLLGQRFCMINKVHQENFEKSFVQQYSMIHRLETNKLRNVAKFFAHLLGTDALPWHVLAYIRLTEEDTTSSSRIFIKILFQELSEHLGIRLLNERLNDPTMQDSFESIFPKDNPKNTRFSINFFTSIGLGGITENLREYLKNMPRLIMQQQKPASESDDESGDSSSSSGSDASSSESESSSSSESDRKKRERKRRRRN